MKQQQGISKGSWPRDGGGVGPAAWLAAAGVLVLGLVLLPGQAPALTTAAPSEEAALEQLFGVEFYLEDPHWRADACAACHQNTPTRDELYLRGDQNTLCTICHSRGRASREPHPVGTFNEAKVDIPAGFPLDDQGALSCLTCHDHVPACRLQERRTKINFLRPVPAESEPLGPRSELLNFCYACHLAADVESYNPHEGQLSNGEIEPRRCLFCHSKALDPREEIKDRQYHLRKDMSVICIGCHLLTPHAGAAEHLEQPPETVAAARREAEQRHGVVLPLDERERISCSTCHNPHQQGVFPAGAPAGIRYDEEQLPPELVQRYERMTRSGVRTTRRNFRLGVPDYSLAMRPLSELKPEKNMRLPARDGTLCAACHGAGGIDR
jgi:predicted CXXCH cytochrome family protein